MDPLADYKKGDIYRCRHIKYKECWSFHMHGGGNLPNPAKVGVRIWKIEERTSYSETGSRY